MSVRGRLAVWLPPGLANWARRWRRPLGELAVQRDLVRTRREVAFLRRAAPVSDDLGGRRVVLLSLSDSVYESKLLLMLASGLRLNGASIRVLAKTRRGTRMAAYARAFGIHDLVGFDGYRLDAPEEDACRKEATRLLSAPVSFSAAKDWSFRGGRVGPHVLSTISRRTLRGAPDLADPEVRAQLAILLPDVLHGVVRAQRAIADLAPDLCLVIEANYAEQGVLVDAAVSAGVGTVQVVQPWRDDALMCRRLTAASRREHPSSLSSVSLARLCAEPWGNREEEELERAFADRYGGTWFLQSRNQRDTRAMGRAEILDRFDLDEGRPLAVVFSHVLWDANLFFGDDLFEDYGDWFVETVRAACGNTQANWLVKLHPANVWKRAYQGVTGEYSEVLLVREALGDLPGHVRLVAPETDVSSLSLYRAADAGVTVRGTPGMEMPCFGKPVLTAGTGRYSGLGFTIDSVTREEYLARLASIHELKPLDPPRTTLAKRHALAVFGARQWRMTSFCSEFAYRTQGSHPLDHNLRARVASLGQLRDNGDLDRWVDWAGRSDEVDYLGG